ncbi:unnamed protein product [Closterium sp. Yama58-4]|nr:unnamed protein product [Closterium sp. Yama58-4]
MDPAASSQGLAISSKPQESRKVSFSERQQQRRRGSRRSLAASSNGDASGSPTAQSENGPNGGSFGFRGHRMKPDKVTFSERQRLRKAGELEEEDAKPIFGNRMKSKVTFSERQRQKHRRRKTLNEMETLECVDGEFGFSWSEYASDSSSEAPTPAGGLEKVEFGEELRDETGEAGEGTVVGTAWKANRGFRVQIRLGGAAKKLVSGAIAGGVSRTVVAPLETIRTHLMVGSSGHRTIVGVFRWIMQKEGWRGLFRGNAINVIRVAPGKAVELATYDTVKKLLTPADGGKPIIPIPPSSIAGSAAGVAACCLMYPLELVKTRLTIQPGEYRSILHAFYRIITEEGAHELYRGLGPSLIGIVPYAGSNYFAYDTLRTLYKKITKKDKIEPLATLVIGSLAGAAAASATFPLEVARKQMQVGALKGRVVYKGTLDCIQRIVQEQGIQGLYRGLVPSCVKLMPAAGISFMCYEALKHVFVDDDDKVTVAKPGADSDSMAAGTNTRSSREFSLRESPTQHNESPVDAPLSAPASSSTAALDEAETVSPPSDGESPPQPLKFPLPAVEFSLRELAACTRGFGPDAMLAMDWAGAVYRGCCHVGKGHVGGRPGYGLHSDAPAATEAPRGSSAVAQPVTKRAESPADLCCCATCQELTATDCVTLRGGCARVKRWRYLPSSLPPPPPSTSAAANATGSTSNDQGAAASESMTSHTPEEAQSFGEVQSGEEVHSSVSAGREMMGRLAEAAASHPRLLPIVGFSCTEELLLVFRSHPSALSLESALARDAMLCGAGSPSALSSWSSRLSVARQIAGGLAHLHAHSFLHASLRPANVLLLPTGSTGSTGTTQRCTPQPPNHLSEQEQRWWRHMLRRKARAEAAAQVRVQLADYGLPCQARDGPGSAGKSRGCVVFGDAKYLDPAFMGSGRYGTDSDVPSSHEVEQLVKGMEGMNVVGELRWREMNGRRLRGHQWALLQ